MVFKEMQRKNFKMTQAKIIKFPQAKVGLFQTVAEVLIIPILFASLSTVVMLAAFLLWPVLSLLAVGQVLDRYFRGKSSCASFVIQKT